MGFTPDNQCETKNEMRSTVYVVMSAYNGERFIAQQIDSILAQENVNVHIIVRDDGSTDNTREILKEYERQNLIEVVYGENLGYSKSFLKLIQRIDSNKLGYVAISDQDDIWDKDKLLNAVNALAKEDDSLPLLYSCGRRLLINNEIKETHGAYIEYGFNGFTNGYALQGCSMVINRKLKELVDMYKYDYLPCIYDALIMQICKYNSGKVVCDKTAHFTYRIHGNNSVGISSGGILGEIRKLVSKTYMPHTDEMCKQLLETYIDDIDSENKRICTMLANYKRSLRDKLCIIFDGHVLRGSICRKMKVTLELLLNRA